MRDAAYPLILPVGTQIVTRVGQPATADRGAVATGAVGVIIKVPADQRHAYRVQLVNGIEVSLKRDEFAIRKQYQQGGLTDRPEIDEQVLRSGIILRVVVGSRAYGLGRESYRYVRWAGGGQTAVPRNIRILGLIGLLA